MKITALDFDDMSSWNCETTGNPGVMLFANAVQVWAVAADRVVTVDEAALVFNVAPDLIRKAVDFHPYMFLEGNTIEHDGE